MNSLGKRLFIFLQHANGFVGDLSQESDGTLRVLAILVALYQHPPPSLIAFEEPELTVHPGAMAVLRDLFVEAATARNQVVLTTHSSDLVSGLDTKFLRVVEMENGLTKVSRLNANQAEALRNHLFTTSELVGVDGGFRGEEI